MLQEGELASVEEAVNSHRIHFRTLQEAVSAERLRAQAQQEQAAAKQSIQQAQQASWIYPMCHLLAEACCLLWLAHVPTCSVCSGNTRTQSYAAQYMPRMLQHLPGLPTAISLRPSNLAYPLLPILCKAGIACLVQAA